MRPRQKRMFGQGRKDGLISKTFHCKDSSIWCSIHYYLILQSGATNSITVQQTREKELSMEIGIGWRWQLEKVLWVLDWGKYNQCESKSDTYIWLKELWKIHSLSYSCCQWEMEIDGTCPSKAYFLYIDVSTVCNPQPIVNQFAHSWLKCSSLGHQYVSPQLLQ